MREAKVNFFLKILVNEIDTYFTLTYHLTNGYVKATRGAVVNVLVCEVNGSMPIAAHLVSAVVNFIDYVCLLKVSVGKCFPELA